MSEGKSRASLGGGIFWSLSTFVATKSITLISTLVLVRLVSPSEFGVLAAVIAYIGLLELLSDLGMKATVVYENEVGITPRVQTAFTLNLAFALALTAIGILLAPFIADFFHAGSQTNLFRLATLDLVLTGLGNVHDSLMLRGMEFRRRIVPQVAMNLLRAVVTITLAAVGLGATALVVGFLAGTAAWTVCLWILTPLRPNFAIERSAVRSMVGYGGWASVLEVLAVVGNRADVAVIGRVLGQGALGIYVIAQRVPELVIENVSWNLSIVAFPALARDRSDSEKSMVPTTLNLIHYGSLFGLPTGAALAILAEPLVVVLFGHEWAAAGGVMTALSVMYALHTAVFPLGDVFKALGRQALMVAINAVSIPAMIVAMALAADGGIVGVVWARVLVSVAQVALLFVLVVRTLRLTLPELGGALRGPAAAAVGVTLGAGGVRLLWPDLTAGPLLVGALAGTLAGIVALYLLAPRDYRDLKALVSRRRGGRDPRDVAPAGDTPATVDAAP